MSTNVYYDPDNLQKTLDSMCKCGHKLMMHAFTMGEDFFSGEEVLYTSQCTSCGWECDCRHFRDKKDANNK